MRSQNFTYVFNSGNNDLGIEDGEHICSESHSFLWASITYKICFFSKLDHLCPSYVRTCFNPPMVTWDLINVFMCVCVSMCVCVCICVHMCVVQKPECHSIIIYLIIEMHEGLHTCMWMMWSGGKHWLVVCNHEGA